MLPPCTCSGIYPPPPPMPRQVRIFNCCSCILHAGMGLGIYARNVCHKCTMKWGITSHVFELHNHKRIYTHNPPRATRKISIWLLPPLQSTDCQVPGVRLKTGEKRNTKNLVAARGHTCTRRLADNMAHIRTPRRTHGLPHREQIRKKIHWKHEKQQFQKIHTHKMSAAVAKAFDLIVTSGCKNFKIR